eukprot:COSAG06_NODE_55139_length_291_cov_0.677083_1_plen_63_part_01
MLLSRLGVMHVMEMEGTLGLCWQARHESNETVQLDATLSHHTIRHSVVVSFSPAAALLRGLLL